jgi:hypothetical protein
MKERRNRNWKFIERLEQAIRVMRSLTPHQRKKHLDMRHWGYETECGTVACAAGHCGMDPWFRRRGFKLSPSLTPPGEESWWSYGQVSRVVTDFFGTCAPFEPAAYDKLPNEIKVGDVLRKMKSEIKRLTKEGEVARA